MLNFVRKRKGSMDLEIKEKEISKNPEEKRYLGIQIPASMYSELRRKSEEEWLSVSDIVRRLIREYLKEAN